MDCAVRAIAICRSLSAETLTNLRTLGTLQRLEPEQPVFHEGDPAKKVFMLTNGSLKIYSLLGDGRRQITGFMFPGDFLGGSVEDEYAFTIEAIETSKLWWFSRRAFQRFVQANPSLERELHQKAAHELATAQRQMVLLGRKTAAERMATFLLNLLERTELVSGRAEKTIDLPMSRLDIADYLGLTKETVSRMLSELRSREVIRLQAQNRVEVLDRGELATVAAGYGAS